MKQLPPPLQHAIAETRSLVRQRRALFAASHGVMAGARVGSFFAIALLLATFAQIYLAGMVVWSFTLVIGLVMLPLLVGFIFPMVLAWLRPWSAYEVAMVLDQHAHTKNRIATAVEFWEMTARTPFHEAAITDGMAATMSLDPYRVVKEKRGGQQWQRAAKRFLPALACLIIYAFLPLASDGLFAPGNPDDPLAVKVPMDSKTLVNKKNTRTASPVPVETQVVKPEKSTTPGVGHGQVDPSQANGEKNPPQTAGRRADPSRTGGVEPINNQDKQGRQASSSTPSGGGKSRSAGIAGQSAGAGSAGGGGKNGGKDKQKKPKSGLPKPKKKSMNPRHSPREETGAGGGMEAGTSRMGGAFAPVAHSWKTTDQGGGEEAGGSDEDEEIDDDKRRSRQRGGMQPSLRDRRPPASRDLGLSQPGDEPGKGRGGPTPPKKSRGTAAMILGRPLPDTVKGLPNPGSAKVQQRRTAPIPAPSRSTAGSRPGQGRSGESPLPGSDRRQGEAEVIKRFFRLLRGLHRMPVKGKKQ